MKNATMLKVAMVVMVFCGATLRTQASDQSSWIGVWNSTLGGQPGVILTLADDQGQLGGTIVFNVIIGPPANAHIAGSDVLLVTHPRLEGDTLSFQVTRSSDAKQLQIAVKSIDSDRAELKCLNCGDSPTATMVKFRP